MTTYTLDGPIASIQTTTDYAITSLNGGALASPTTVSPSGHQKTVIIASEGSSSNDNWFKMSSSFNVGDVVEIYNDSPTRLTMHILDENGNEITCNGLTNPNVANKLIGGVYRKVRSITGSNWGFTD